MVKLFSVCGENLFVNVIKPKVNQKLFSLFLKITIIFVLAFLPVWSLSTNNSENNKNIVDYKTVDNQKDTIIKNTNNENLYKSKTSYYKDPTLASRSEATYTSVWVKLIVIMVIFVVSCLIILAYLKKKNNIVGNDNELFELISEYSLAMNKKIKIMRIVNDFFVLSDTQDGISLINKIEDKESLDKLQLELGRVTNKKYFFTDFLSHYVSGQKFQAFSITNNLKKRLNKS